MRLGYSDHLVDLVAEAHAAAARLAAAEPGARRALTAAARRESARRSVRLDATPLSDAAADEVDRREDEGLPKVADRPGGVSPAAEVTAGWARSLKVDRAVEQDVAAREYANLLDCFDAEAAVGSWFLDRPRAALAELHAIICGGLLEPGAAGRPRRTELAVHDGAQGRVLFHAAPPARLDALLDELEAWVVGPGGRTPALVLAGVVHERILQWQPFEVANGRLARVASRVVLRARGVDRDGVAVAERLLGADPAAYYGEVSATIRRRDDLGPWLERTAEAVVAGLRAAADAAGVAPPDPPPRAAAVAGGLEAGDTVTVAEYAQRSGTGRAGARADLHALVDARWLEPVPGTRGLRFRRR